MLFRTLQGLSSPTFRPPPPDGSLTLVEVFDYHGKHNPQHPLFRYRGVDGSVNTINWLSATRAVHVAARRVQQYVIPETRYQPPPTVSILATADSILYFTLISGIMRAGFQAFPISPRNSIAAVTHLLKATNSKCVFVSSDPAMQKLAEAATANILTEDASNSIKLLPMPIFESLFSSAADFEPLPPIRGVDLDTPAMILHSSGSTAFPKPVPLTYRALLQSGLVPYYGETDICGETLSSHAVPMFHVMGVVQIPRTAYCGLTIATFPPTFPPIFPTPDIVLDSAIATNCTLMFCVPAFLEAWAQDPSRLTTLQKFKTIIFSGGPLQPSVGNMLVENRVNIIPVYSLTEVGTLASFLPTQPPKEGWQYFQFSSHCDPVCVPLEGQSDVYRLIAKESPSHTPAIFNTMVDGVRAFDTNDLLVRHPTNPKLWKVFGRQDDQIMHSTGEKTNPMPIEAILLRNQKIKSAIMFGRSQFHAGVLVLPDEPFDPTNLDRLAEYRNEIWSTVEQANEFAPTHSKIFKEMILVANPMKPFELTAKGTPRRHVVLNTYADEIKEVYRVVEQSSQTHLKPPLEFTLMATLDFVRRALAEVMSKVPSDDGDIFQHGCDSLGATWLRNTILHAIRQHPSKIDTRTIPHGFVYGHPTIRQLAAYVTQVAQGTEGSAGGVAQKISAMRGMVEKYSVGFQEPVPIGQGPLPECVLLTGTTGVFGSYILKSLLQQPGIDIIYAMNRTDSKDGKSVIERQKAAFEECGIDTKLIGSTRLQLVEGDLNATNFGLDESLYREMHTRTTTIIHNAWKVDFNLTLASMEPLIAGTRRLIDFALSAPRHEPARFVFVSTVSVTRNWTTSSTVPEGPITDPAISAGSGYSDSKWVAEQILSEAANYGLSPIVIRPGQMSGGKGGAWKTNEWFPALVRFSQVSGRVPSISGMVSWIPIDEAAAALVELRNSNERYLHLAHPKPVPFSLILQSLSAILDVPRVPYAEWLDALEVASARTESGADNPAVHLLGVFRSRKDDAGAEGNESEAFTTSLATDLAAGSAPSLRNAAQLGPKDVAEWVAYWRRIGFLS